MMDLEDIHPLKDRTYISDILPFLKHLPFCKKKKNFKLALKQSMLKEMRIKFSKSEEIAINEPYLFLGYGINAYFDLMLSLIYMFIAITIFSLPMYYAFSKNKIDYFSDKTSLNDTSALKLS